MTIRTNQSLFNLGIPETIHELLQTDIISHFNRRPPTCIAIFTGNSVCTCGVSVMNELEIDDGNGNHFHVDTLPFLQIIKIIKRQICVQQYKGIVNILISKLFRIHYKVFYKTPLYNTSRQSNWNVIYRSLLRFICIADISTFSM